MASVPWFHCHSQRKVSSTLLCTLPSAEELDVRWFVSWLSWGQDEETVRCVVDPLHIASLGRASHDAYKCTLRGSPDVRRDRRCAVFWVLPVLLCSGGSPKSSPFAFPQHLNGPVTPTVSLPWLRDRGPSQVATAVAMVGRCCMPTP